MPAVLPSFHYTHRGSYSQFIAGGSSSTNLAISISLNGTNWFSNTRLNSTISNTTIIQTITSGNGIYSGVLNDTVANTSHFVYSSDGIQWKYGALNSLTSAFSSCYGNGLYVVAGSTSNGISGASINSYIYTSSNGINYNNTYQPYNGGLYSNTFFNSACYGNGKFIVVGSTTYLSTNYGAMTISSDGATWSNSSSVPTGAQNANTVYNSVCYGNGIYVAVGYGIGVVSNSNIISSTNATSWSGNYSANTQDRNQLNAVCYGNGIFVAVGSNGSIQTSSNGTSWTNRTSANTRPLIGVAYGNGIYVAVDTSGTGQYSTNAITWTNLPSSIYGSASIIYG